MKTDPHVAVCWSCGWARVGYSHTEGIKRIKEHQRSGCQTDLIAESDVESLDKHKSSAESLEMSAGDSPMSNQPVNRPELEEAKADAEEIMRDMRELFKELNRL